MEKTYRPKFRFKTALVLSAAVLITCLIVFNEYIFGDRILAFYDIGSDTSQQYLPQILTVVRKLHEGDITLWDATNGFGVNMNMLTITNPFFAVIYLVGALLGEKAVFGAMIWLYVAEIVAAGLAAYLFMSAFRLSERAKCIASYMYAFNGFMLVWGQHYQFAAVPVLLMLELFFAERCIRAPRKWKALTLMTTLVVINSMYTAYMILLFSGVYVVVRVFLGRLRGFFGYVRDVFHLAWVMGLGVGIGFITLLPNISAILSVSSRLASEATLMERLFGYRYPIDYYQALVGRMFMTTAKGISSYRGYLNYYEDPNLFLSTLSVILLAQYVFLIPRISMGLQRGEQAPLKRTVAKRIIAQYLLLFLCAFAAGFPTVGTVLNGFTAPFSRFFFLFMPYLSLISASVLSEIFRQKRISIPGLLFAAAGILFVYIRYIFMPDAQNPWYVPVFHLAGGLCMCVLVLFLGLKKEILPKKYLAVILGMVLMMNVGIDAVSNFRNRETVMKDGEYFERLYDGDTLEALAYLKETDDEYYRVEKTYGATLCMDSLAQGYHSVSTYNSTQNANIQNFIREDWPGILYADINHYMYILGCTNRNEAELVGIKYVLSESDDAGIPGMEKMKTFGRITVYTDPSVRNIASFYPRSVVEPTYGIDANGFTGTAFVRYADRNPSAEITLKDQVRDDRIDGTAEVPEDGLLLIAIPFEHGWDVYVDGVEVEQRKVEHGFIGVELAAGRHEISVRYLCPGLVKGTAISVFSLLLFGLFIILEHIYVKRKRSMNP